MLHDSNKDEAFFGASQRRLPEAVEMQKISWDNGIDRRKLNVEPHNDLGYPVGEVARLSISYGPGVVVPAGIRILYFMNAQES